MDSGLSWMILKKTKIRQSHSLSSKIAVYFIWLKIPISQSILPISILIKRILFPNSTVLEKESVWCSDELVFRTLNSVFSTSACVRVWNRIWDLCCYLETEGRWRGGAPRVPAVMSSINRIWSLNMILEVIQMNRPILMEIKVSLGEVAW